MLSKLMILTRQMINYENIRCRRDILGCAVWAVNGNSHQTVKLDTYSSYICQGSGRAGKPAHRLCHQHPYSVHNFRNTNQTSKPSWSLVPPGTLSCRLSIRSSREFGPDASCLRNCRRTPRRASIVKSLFHPLALHVS